MKRSYTLLVIFSLVIFLFSSNDIVSGDLYKWTDKKGEVHITDYPPSQNEQGEGSVEVIEEKGFKAKVDKTIKNRISPFLSEKTKKLKEALGVDSEVQSAKTLFDVLKDRFYELKVGLKVLIIGVFIFVHLYYALCLYLIGRKTGVSSAWLAWIPVVNVFPLVLSAGKPWWWGVFFLIPLTGFIPILISNVFFVLFLLFIILVDAILFIIVWIKICANFWIEKWFGLLILVPVTQFALIGYLAFKNEPHRDDIHRLRSALIALFCFLLLLGASYASMQFFIDSTEITRKERLVNL
jgi:hypothetical protein